jgi:flagellar motor switch protein FliM
LTYGEFLSLLPTPTVLSVIEIPELEGNVAIELNPNIAFSFIDRLLGGFGTPIGKVRSLTAIEQALMERVLQKCCQELDMIWAPIVSLSFQPQSIEGNPELARVVGPNEMVILISMEIRIHEVAGMMNLCLPYVVMEPAIQRLGQATTYPRKSGQASEPLRTAIETSVRSAMLAVDVDLGHAEITLSELLDLEEGDILRFSSPCDGGARASVEGVPRLDGRPGRSRGHMAFEVTEIHPKQDSKEGKA